MIFRVGVSRTLSILFCVELTVCPRPVGDTRASSHARARPGLRQSSRLVNGLLVLGERQSHNPAQVTRRSLAPHAVHARSQVVVRGKSPRSLLANMPLTSCFALSRMGCVSRRSTDPRLSVRWFGFLTDKVRTLVSDFGFFLNHTFLCQRSFRSRVARW